MADLRSGFGRLLAHHLTQPVARITQPAIHDAERLAVTLRPADILLVEGNSRISAAIKYLTQSTWSHAALCVGDALGPPPPGGEPKVLVEADLLEGVRAVPLSQHHGLHTRICRPVGLTDADRRRVIDFALSRLGEGYDLKNLIDLGRYLLPMPPLPSHWRRRFIALGSGEPTRAICSTLIAQAFQSVRYPILPEISAQGPCDAATRRYRTELLHIRHYSLFAPRDFDISPYFAIVKPVLEEGFDYKALRWDDGPTR